MKTKILAESISNNPKIAVFIFDISNIAKIIETILVQ